MQDQRKSKPNFLGVYPNTIVERNIELKKLNDALAIKGIVSNILSPLVNEDIKPLSFTS